MSLAAVFEHRDFCPTPEAPPEAFVGKFGDPLLICRTCRAMAVDVPTVDEASLPAETRQVCGLHPGQPVDGRGRGCRDCAAEANAREAAHQRRVRGRRDRQAALNSQ